MDRSKIVEMLKSTDWEMIELGIILFLQQPDEWCKTIIPWNSFTYESVKVAEDGTFLRGEDRRYIIDRLFSPTFKIESREVDKKIWIKDNKTIAYGIVGYNLVYRSLGLMKCHVDFDKIEKVYL